MASYRILACDGGGVRGALTATLLRRLHDEFPNLLDTVDLFAGTSAGAFVALGLASGYSPARVAELFSPANARFIFSPRRLPLIRPKYDNDHLARLLAAAFPVGVTLGDLPRRVLVPAFRVLGPEGGIWRPVFLHNFPGSPHRQQQVIETALYSSAAPVYFPSFGEHIDGGVIANNPSFAAISLAVDEQWGGRPLDDVALLSLGTGYNPLRITANTETWGALQWTLNWQPPVPLFSVITDGASAVSTLFSAQLLGERFFRLNPELPEPVALDDYTQVPDLVAMAEAEDLTPVADWLQRQWFGAG